jgi:hypothetical protein
VTAELVIQSTIADNDVDYPLVQDRSLEDEDDCAEVAQIIDHPTRIKIYLKHHQDKIRKRRTRTKKNVLVTGDDANSTLTPSTNCNGCRPRSSSSISTNGKTISNRSKKSKK